MNDITRSGRPESLSNLAVSGTALLTTFRSNGEPVATPVSIAVEGDLAYFTTAVDSGKAGRLASNDAVTIAPCTTDGTVTGPTVAATAQLLDPAQRARRRRVLRPTRALFWSYLLYRLRGRSMRLYEVRPAPDNHP